MTKPSRILAALLSTAAAVTVVAPSAATGASTGVIDVTNQNDRGPGSLRQAIADADPGELVSLPAGTYILSSGQLAVTKSLTISGAGAATTVIDAQTASRVFHTSGAGNQITISGVTIRDGKAVPAPGTSLVEGGGVLNEKATLTLSDDVISGNQAFADTLGRGGAGGDAEGGGVFSSGGTLNLVDTDVRGNSATAVGGFGQHGGLAVGGGAETFGAVAVRGSTFESNLADARGGQGPVNTNQSGGIASGGGLVIDTGLGQAASVSATTFDDNVAEGSGRSRRIRRVRVRRRRGGANAFSPLPQTNVTYTGNVAQALAGQTEGGGIFFEGDGQGESLTNATVSGNSATSGLSNLGGNIVVNIDVAVAIENSVISAGAADPGMDNCAVFEGTLSSLGHNIDDRDQCNFHAAGDRVNTSPLLAGLADNGGPVHTIALQPGSPAIDTGAAAACPTTDARGVLRPAGNGCEIGGFEIATPSAATGHPSAITTSSAVLNGIASNPDLAGATAFFQYGTTTAYGKSTPVQRVSAITAHAQFSAQPSGLSPATTYHFRIVVMNAIGSVVGADQTLTTARLAANPPAKHATAPRITALKVTPAAVSPKRGAKITYSASEAATTTFSVQRRRSGRVQRHVCVKQTKKNRNHKRCTRWVKTGHVFTHADTPGRQQFRLATRAIANLTRGRYRLTATPRANGLTGHRLTTGFHVVRR